MPITAVDSISPAIEHTKQQLFKPFRLGQWTKLAIVGLLAGELGSSGFNRSNFQMPRHSGGPLHPEFPPGIDHALLGAFIASAIVAALAIGLIFLYVNSVMRFVLFDSIILKETHVRWSWGRRLGAGWRYFVWRLGYFLIALGGILLLVGVPLAIAFTNGWFKEPKAHVPAFAIGGILMFLVLFVFGVGTAVVFVLTKDFVVPQMALENVTVTAGWRRFWPMMMAEKGAYVAYLAMKIVLTTMASILIGVATIILGLLFVVPSVGLSILAVLTGKSAGLTWNAHTIALAVVIGCILLAAFLYLIALVSVPAIVFFPAYSIYFFASRYPRLAAALSPDSAPAPLPAGAQPSFSPSR